MRWQQTMRHGDRSRSRSEIPRILSSLQNGVNGAFLLRAFQELPDTPFSRFLISFRISPWPQARLSIELGRADLGV